MTASPREVLRQWLVTGELPRPRDSGEAANWVTTAAAEGVAGLLYADLDTHGRGWPDEAGDRLRQMYHASFQTGIQRLDLAARVLARLSAAGLRALPLKGAAVAELLYASVAERPMMDVDLLVLDDWPASIQVLRDAGFLEIERADHAWGFGDPERSQLVEVHHSLTSSAGFYPVDRDGLWARSRRAQGQVRRVPSSEDLLVQLALHATFHHGLGISLVQHLDLRRLLERPFDEDLLWDIARGARAEAALAVALLACSEVVGAPLGPTLRERLPAVLPRRLRDSIVAMARTGGSVALVARMRWELAAGRRTEMLWRTVAPEIPGVHRSLFRRLPSAAGRALALAWRWGLHALPAWGRLRWNRAGSREAKR